MLITVDTVDKSAYAKAPAGRFLILARTSNKIFQKGGLAYERKGVSLSNESKNISIRR